MYYETFCDELLLALEHFSIPRESCTFSSAMKNNGVKIRTLLIRSENDPITPSFNMENYFASWQDGRSIEDIAKELADITQEKPSISKDIGSLQWEAVKDYIVFTIINFEANKDFLRNVPHIRILDLVIIFKLDSEFLNISGFITITNQLMHRFKVNKKALFTAAYKNTPKLYPLQFLKFNDLFDTEAMGIDPEAITTTIIWLATNSEKIYGASVMLYNEFFDKLRDLSFEDCIILPSSVHEVLLVHNDKPSDKEFLKQMVNEVNQAPCMSPVDILSGSVYQTEEVKKALELVIKSYYEEGDGNCVI